MRTRKLFLYAAIAMLLPFVASCDNDNGGNEPGGSTEVTLPSMDFGQTMSRIQEIEADRGFTVTQTERQRGEIRVCF